MSNASEFGQLLAELHTSNDQEQTVQRVAETAVQMLDCDAAGVMLVHSGKRIETAAFTDASVRKADLLQLRLDEGPCLSAMAGGDHYRIDNTTTDQRWPRWCPAVAELGVRSVVSVRLANGDNKPVGSLLIYSHRVGAFDSEDEATARILGTHAAIAVHSVRNQAAAERAIDGRTVIGQAQGVVMAKYEVGADQAFAVLVRCSQQKNVKLRDVAKWVVEHRTLPPMPVG